LRGQGEVYNVWAGSREWACQAGGLLKIMATFDGTTFSEATLPLLARLANLPEAQFVLVSVSHEPSARQRGAFRHRALPSAAGTNITQSEWTIDPASDPEYTERQGEAFDRRLTETRDYLSGLAAKLPDTVPVHVEAHISNDVADTIIERARAETPDVIVMATHSHTGIKALFGSTTDRVIRAAVAPVLVVHPTS
jgi:nucleotide-binding universal stress UspA family protein